MDHDDPSDLDDDAAAEMLLIPLLWASKMIQANTEFLEEIGRMPIDDILVRVKRMLERKVNN